MPNKPVPWLKLWPELVDHEKFAQLSDSECWTWVKALAKSGLQPTRGRYQSVQHAVVVTGRPKKHFDRLLQVRLMDQREDGLWMHDWEKWQRWRPEDSAMDETMPPDQPPNGNGSTRDEHTNGYGTSVDQHAINTRSTREAQSPLAPSSLSPKPPISLPPLPPEEIRLQNENARAKRATAITDEPSPGDDRVDEVYAHFKARVQPRSRLNPRKKIAARLKRFSVAELKEGIDHFADDPWWMEHNASRGAEWFFEADSRSEHFLLMSPRVSNVVPLGKQPSTPTRLPIDRTGVAN